MARSKDSVSEVTLSAMSKVIDSRRLLYFYHVAQSKRFTAAEALLDVAQSAISRQIQQLENDLGVQLLNRTGHGVELTESGKILYSHAETILNEMGATVEEIQTSLHSPSGSVSIASPPSFNNFVMADVIEEFSAQCPAVRIRLIEASTGGVYSHLANGDVDLAIVTYPASSAKYNTQQLMSEPLFAICHPDHDFAKLKWIDLKMLNSTELILPASLQGTRSTLKEFFDMGDVPLISRREVDSLPLMLQLVRRKFGVALLPLMACMSDVKAGRVVPVPLVPELKRTIYAASLLNKADNPWLQTLKAIIVAQVNLKISR